MLWDKLNVKFMEEGLKRLEEGLADRKLALENACLQVFSSRFASFTEISRYHSNSFIPPMNHLNSPNLYRLSSIISLCNDRFIHVAGNCMVVVLIMVTAMGNPGAERMSVRDDVSSLMLMGGRGIFF